MDYITKSIIDRSNFFPTTTIRELVTNALIHQNFNVKGSPVVSIFKDHIEILNPGEPLIESTRFLDFPPVTRNESLVYVMRKVGICESLGSGYDKVISLVEENNLPAPIITVSAGRTKVCLYAKAGFDSLTKEEKIMACFEHVCLNYERNIVSNNTTLRQRFRLSEVDKYKISRIYADTCKRKLIKKKGSGMKNREYIPYWINSCDN